MLVLRTGAWNNKPISYKSIQDYLTEEKAHYEKYVNNFIEEHYPTKEKFFMGVHEIDTVASYVDTNRLAAWPHEDGSFDKHRFVNLCLDGIDYLLKIRGFYR